jgi:hypothetical protein
MFKVRKEMLTKTGFIGQLVFSTDLCRLSCIATKGLQIRIKGRFRIAASFHQQHVCSIKVCKCCCFCGVETERRQGDIEQKSGWLLIIWMKQVLC